MADSTAHRSSGRRDSYLEQLAGCRIESWHDVARLLGVLIWDNLDGFNREAHLEVMSDLEKVRVLDPDLYLALEEDINQAILDAVQTGFLAGIGLGRTSCTGPVLPVEEWVAKSLDIVGLAHHQPDGDVPDARSEDVPDVADRSRRDGEEPLSDERHG